MRIRLFVLTAVGTALLSCSGSDSWSQPFEPMVCDMEDYSWIAPSEMGKVVFYEKDLVLSLPRDGIQTLLDGTEYAGALDIKYGADIYWVRYETQDRGLKLEATAVVGVPQLEGQDAASMDAPYVLWLHGTTGFMDDCAPSGQGIEGAAPGLLMASQGYITVAPDYIGMNGFGDPSEMFHTYLIGESTAMGSWDSVRAAEEVLREESSPVEPDGRVVLWGGSQGGHAAFFTELYAPYYVPHLEVAAAVALVPPTDLVRQTRAAIETFGSATPLTAAALVQMARWYGYRDELDQILNSDPPLNLADELPELMDTTCEVDVDQHDIDDATDIFTEDLAAAVLEDDWQGYEQWRCMLEENSVATTSVERRSDTPFLFVLSENDGLVDTPIEREEFDRLCEMGYRMEYIECAGAGHTEGAIWSLPEQLAWVEQRLAGADLTDPCNRTEPVCCSGSDESVCTPR
jgi:pimeloyl-ACP methyl ester carboxylesterase